MKRRRRLYEIVSDGLGFPDSISPSVSDIHIVGTRELMCRGCRGILVYEDDEIQLRLRRGIMKIAGEGLGLQSYFGYAVSVKGKIEAVSFYGEEGQ